VTRDNGQTRCGLDRLDGSPSVRRQLTSLETYVASEKVGAGVYGEKAEYG
jgi:hypothetical protein